MNQPLRKSSGRLFPKAPDGNKPTWTGDLTLTQELIQEINKMAARGEVRLRLACWPKQSQRPGGGEYLSVSADMDRIQPGDQQQPQVVQQRARPAGYQGGVQRAANYTPGRPPNPQARVDRPGFQSPQPPRQLPQQGNDFPFDDPADFNEPWRR